MAPGEPLQVAVLAVIPARGGSKRLPRKNVLPLAGKPLIAYTIEAARAARSLTRTVVSTDDEEIADVARQYGADVPFMRPPNLATDTAGSVDVLVHALEFCSGQDGMSYDIAVLLQPTSPLRGPSEVDDAVALVVGDPKVPAAITVAPVDSTHPNYVYRRQHSGYFTPYNGPDVLGVRAQEFEPLYIRTGSVYAVRTSYLVRERRIMAPETAALVVHHDFYVNIDDARDFLLAEFCIARRQG